MKTVIPSISFDTLIWHANRDAPGEYRSPFLCRGVGGQDNINTGTAQEGSIEPSARLPRPLVGGLRLPMFVEFTTSLQTI